MRILLKVNMSVQKANALAREGKLGSTIQEILEEMKPEAAYFVADRGMRTGYLVCQIADSSEIPRLSEPWFLALDAGIELQPAMSLEDLAKAGPDMEKAASRW